jgi:hypothetical protein
VVEEIGRNYIDDEKTIGETSKIIWGKLKKGYNDLED